MEGQSSTPLTEKGMQQAQQLARVLVAAASNKSSTAWPTHIYTSPLCRAKQTAQQLTDALARSDCFLQTISDSRLQEIHQGIFQGLTWLEAQVQFPNLCTQLCSSLEWQPVPGAESPSAARARSHQWLQHILRTHQPEDTLWIVSHAGIMQHLISEIMGCDRTWKTTIGHTATFEFWLSYASENSNDINSQIDSFNPERWILRRFNQSFLNKAYL